MNIVTKTIANYIEENKKCIICFDLFDTLISRRFSPEEVKKTYRLTKADKIENIFNTFETIEKIMQAFK